MVLQCAGHLSRRGAWPRPLGQITRQSQGAFPETCPPDRLSSRAKIYLDGEYSVSFKPEVIICQGVALCRPSVQKRGLAEAPRTDHPAESGSSPRGIVSHVSCAHVVFRSKFLLQVWHSSLFPYSNSFLFSHGFAWCTPDPCASSWHLS